MPEETSPGEKNGSPMIETEAGDSCRAEHRAEILDRGNGPGRRDPTQRWLTFIRNHAQEIVACDFFTVVTVGFCSLYVLVVMELVFRPRFPNVNGAGTANAPVLNHFWGRIRERRASSNVVVPRIVVTACVCQITKDHAEYRGFPTVVS